MYKTAINIPGCSNECVVADCLPRSASTFVRALAVNAEEGSVTDVDVDGVVVRGVGLLAIKVCKAN